MIRTAPPDAVSRLLIARLAETGDPERSPTLAELVRDLLPYATVRGALGLTTKAEYDLALLGWLGSEEHARVDPPLADAVERELRAPEPGLGFVEQLADSRIDAIRSGSGERVLSPEVAPRRRSRNGVVEAEGEPSTPEPGPSTKGDRPRTPVGLDPGSVRGEAAAADEPAAVRVHLARDRGFFPIPPPRGAGLVFRFAPDEPVRAPAASGEAGNGSRAAEKTEPAGKMEPAERAEPAGGTEPATEPQPGSPARPAPTRCRECSRPLPARAAVKFCPHCGADQSTGRCTACGDRLDAEWAFCPRCGRPVEQV